MCFFSCASRLVFFIYGTLGPAYHTYKTLNNGDDEFLAWAKYWIVYAFLVTFELLADALLSWMAVYMPIKLIFMVWIVLTAPSANVWMFDSILHPLLVHRQEQIDQFLNRGKYKILNDSLRTLSLMCVNGRTFMKPLMHWWSKTKMGLRMPNKLDNLTDATAGGNDQGSDESSTSVQTSRINVCTRSSPHTSFTQITDNSEEMQPALHSNRSFDLATNIISPEPSSATVRRQVSRKGKMSKVSKTESSCMFSSQINLITPKEKLYDGVEDLLASSRIEPDGQDVRQQRQLATRNRTVISQQ
ncbi:uncharacterized protein T19C3.4 [Drosophila serrata]|uniref:uncharacterized protein T19C3.4 n=1 Tax=Drosophila serrata TaxID=7274 RepID=UPI000A1D1E4D|nr:uncharacterized protein T19C3.4 [Drosophila serrata]